ncbi:DENN domain-containing protein 1A [Hypsibius exemplaris]|uniref:DENN domain-containing protein 1A n=1 Tax=Hypsibius exemplaris TaxID=2072580 RepID=A0A1W0WRM9_HYPEX|nr:DENN domain-containing protein 1A [Hypsibius exemplaris]
MGSRIREQPERLFTLFTEVVAPENGADGWILQKFPDEFEQQDVLKNIPLFCFPTASQSSGPVQHFCFVLTDVDSMFTFGFCRLTTDGKTCICILSSLPWHDVFYKLLNYIVDLMTKHHSDDLLGFLKAAYRTAIPGGGEELHIIHLLQKVEFQALCPDAKRLPTIPENRALTEYFNALDFNNMITIFASLLNERRILITSKKLGRLTACVMACNILLYPMRWQHIFVPVLPKKLLEYVTAPMPFIIGVPSELMPAVLNMDLGEVVIVDADQNTVETPFQDAQLFPSSVISSIRSGAGKMFGDGVARSFMRALVEIIGGYRFGLCLPAGEKISFDMDKFIRNRPANLQPILSKLTDHQIFRQGIGFSDEFEQEVSLLIDHESGSNRDASIADQYYKWSSKGGDIFRSMTNKVKDKSRGAVKGIRSKMQDRSSKVPDLSFSDRFGGSEPTLSLPAQGSPPQSRLYATNLPQSSNLQHKSSLKSRESLERSMETRSLGSTNTQSAGLTVDMPAPRSPRPASDPAVVVSSSSPIKETALISFDDDNAVDDSFDSFLTPAHQANAPTDHMNRQSFANTLNSLYANKARQQHQIGPAAHSNGRMALQMPPPSASPQMPRPSAAPPSASPQMPRPSAAPPSQAPQMPRLSAAPPSTAMQMPRPLAAPPSWVPQLLGATRSAPVFWDGRPRVVSPQPPSFGYGVQQSVLSNAGGVRPNFVSNSISNTLVPRSNSPASAVTSSAAESARRLEEQLLQLKPSTPDNGWENFS